MIHRTTMSRITRALPGKKAKFEHLSKTQPCFILNFFGYAIFGFWFVIDLVCLFFCLFVVIQPENPFFASRPGLEVKPLGVYPLGPRSSSCSPIKGTPPPRIVFEGIYTKKRGTE